MSSGMIYCLPNLNLRVLKGTLFSGLIANYQADLNLLYVETALLSFDISRLESLKDRSWVLNIHINNISKGCHNSGVALFADDTEIHFISKDVGKTKYIIDKDLKSINQWFANNGLICNTKKIVTMVIASHRAVKTARDVHISYGDSLLEQKRSFKYLSVIVDESFSWNSHISYVASRVYPKLSC